MHFHTPGQIAQFRLHQYIIMGFGYHIGIVIKLISLWMVGRVDGIGFGEY